MSHYDVGGDGGSGPGPVFPNNFPITPYVVGPVGQAGYQTIQSAINAADGNGGGLVWIQTGSYNENLTLKPNVVLQGDGNLASEIVGAHLFPEQGFGQYINVRFTSASVSFNTTSAAATPLFFDSCLFSCLDGFSFNLTNWTGSINLRNCICDGPEDGFLFLTSFGTIVADSCILGAGSTHTLTTDGDVTLRNSTLNCKSEFESLPDFFNCTINNDVILDNDLLFNNCVFNSTILQNDINIGGTFNNCVFNSGSSPAYTMNGNGTLISFSDCIVNSSANPCITGNGNTPIKFTNMAFTDSSTINPSLVLIYGTELTGNLNTRGGTSVKVTVVTNALSPYTVLSTDQFIACDGVAGAITLTLPASPITGTIITVCDSTGHAAANNITIDGNGNQISYAGVLAANLTMTTNFQLVSLTFNGSFWNAV